MDKDLKGSALLPVIAAGLTPFVVLATIVLVTSVTLIAWSPPLLWADHFGITSPFPDARGAATTAMTIASDDLYVAGISNYTIHASGLVFLARYDSGGHETWTRTVSGNISTVLNSQPNPVSGISPLSNYVYIAANTNESSLIMKYDKDGNRVWISQFGGPWSRIDAISATANGVYVIGYHYPGASIQEFDFGGNLVWTASLNDTVLIDLKAGPAGVYVLTSDSIMRFDQNGNRLWTRSNSCTTCTVGASLSEDDTGVYVNGDNGFVRKYATDGPVLWSAGFHLTDSSDRVEYSSVSADGSRVYDYLTTYFATNAFLVKYDSSGTQIWSVGVPFQGRGWDHSAPYLSASGGGVYIGGSAQSGTAFVEEFGGSLSLVFLGINPPWSFVTLAALVAVVAVGLVLSIRKSKREMMKHPRSVRARGFSKMPSD